jgi:hypothetical protein
VTALVARVLAGVTAAAGAAVLFGPVPAAVAGGLLLGFVLPGLALTAAMFRDRELTGVERAMLAPALSLAVLVVGGLAGYLAGLRLDRTLWTVVTGGVTLASLLAPAVPLARRYPPEPVSPLVADRRVATAGGAGPGPATTVLERRRAATLARQLIPLGVAVAMLASASWLSLTSARHSYHVVVTALSAAPPGAASTTGRRAVVVTATGLVPADGPYALVVTAPDGIEAERRSIGVPPGGTWTGSLTVGLEHTTIGLYRARDTTAYRTVYVAAAQ